jgi:hypothetical protein
MNLLAVNTSCIEAIKHNGHRYEVQRCWNLSANDNHVYFLVRDDSDDLYTVIMTYTTTTNETSSVVEFFKNWLMTNKEPL